LKKNRIAVALAALLAVPAFSQQPPAPAPAGETIEVQITNLDVVVTDSKGKRATGLTKDDLEVYENGQKREITNLSEVGVASTTGAEVVQPAPRRILLIVDNSTIALGARRKIFDATRATLDKLLVRSSDRIAIATISHSIKQRLGWTSDRAEIDAALKAVEKDAILPNSDLAEFEHLLDQIKSDADVVANAMGPLTQTTLDENGNPSTTPIAGSSNNKTGRGGVGAPPVNFQVVVARARGYAHTATNETKQTLSALNAAMTAFAAVPGGRKIIILAGGQLPLNAGDAIFQRIESLRSELEMGGHRGFVGTRTATTMTQNPAFDIAPMVDALAANARLKGVAIYAVNPEFGDRGSHGASSRGPGDNIAEFAVLNSKLDGYDRLTSLTGGTAMIGGPADMALTEIQSDLSSYYSLAYRSSGPLTPKSQILVKAKNGLKTRSVIASGAISRDWEVSDQVLANHTVDPVNPLGISVAMDAPVMDGDRKTIPLRIMIPVDSLKMIKDGGEYEAGFSVFVSIGDEGGNGSDPNRQEQTFRWPENVVAQVKGKTIGFAVNVGVEPGRDRISVGVLDQFSGVAGYQRVMVQ
jgi:VWFA-related protein